MPIHSRVKVELNYYVRSLGVYKNNRLNDTY